MGNYRVTVAEFFLCWMDGWIGARKNSLFIIQEYFGVVGWVMEMDGAPSSDLS